MDTGPDSARVANLFRFMAIVHGEDRVEGHAAWSEERCSKAADWCSDQADQDWWTVGTPDAAGVPAIRGRSD
jgi:hypothetical protein|tara:strand:+ start:51 stop:266 length:216 start_codon:yes stop_codon:yes gene_type:complete